MKKEEETVFEKNLVSGYVHEDHIDSVLTDECYRKLYGKGQARMKRT